MPDTQESVNSSYIIFCLMMEKICTRSMEVQKELESLKLAISEKHHRLFVPLEMALEDIALLHEGAFLELRKLIRLCNEVKEG